MLQELQIKQIKQINKVLIDMDGVVADFQKLAEKIAGCSIEVLESRGEWQEFKEETLCNSNFFFELDEMPLVKTLKKYIGKWEILTAVGDYNSAGVVEMKKMWLEKVFGEVIKFNYVIKTKEKALYATPNTLLVDDREKSVTPFAENGGQIIFFKNTTEEIELVEAVLKTL